MGGNAPRLAGQSWENILQFQAQREGIVLVKQQPEVLFTGKGQAHIVNHAWVDYMGSWQGRAFTMEAKSTANKGMLKAPKDRMHQFFTMRDVADRLPSFYLVYWREHELVAAYLIGPDDEWPYWMEVDDGLAVKVNMDLDRLWLGSVIERVMMNWDSEYGR